MEIQPDVALFIREHRVARLATADGEGQPAAIPICYVFNDGHLYSPIDDKPKQVAPRQLRRVRNIEANPRVALVIDDYGEDWSKLAYVLITGLAAIIYPGSDEHARAVGLLRDKYSQYLAMSIDEHAMIRISPMGIKYWRGDESTPGGAAQE